MGPGLINMGCAIPQPLVLRECSKSMGGRGGGGGEPEHLTHP